MKRLIRVYFTEGCLINCAAQFVLFAPKRESHILVLLGRSWATLPLQCSVQSVSREQMYTRLGKKHCALIVPIGCTNFERARLPCKCDSESEALFLGCSLSLTCHLVRSTHLCKQLQACLLTSLSLSATQSESQSLQSCPSPLMASSCLPNLNTATSNLCLQCLDQSIMAFHFHPDQWPAQNTCLCATLSSAATLMLSIPQYWILPSASR